MKLIHQIQEYLFSRYSKESAQTYLYHIESFLVKHPHANMMGQRGIEKYMADLKLKGQSIGYRTVTLAAIKVYYDFAILQKKVVHHPCRSLFLSEKQPSGMNFNEMLTLLEMEQLFEVLPTRYNCIKHRNKSILGILIYQGVSSNELIELKPHHLDFDNGTITIPYSSKRKRRTLALKPSQVVDLIRYLEEERPKLTNPDFPYLFVSMRGMKMTTNGIHGFIHQLSGGFYKEISPQNIRKSVISYWLNQRKLPLEDVQIMAGHHYPSTTEKYIQQDVLGQRDAVSRLHEEVFGE